MRRFQESKQKHYPSDIWNNSTFSVRPRNTPGDEIFYGDGRPKRISSGSTRWTVMRTLRKLQNADLCSKNGHYLVMVDQFSGWPQVVAFPDENTTTQRLINAFRQSDQCYLTYQKQTTKSLHSRICPVKRAMLWRLHGSSIWPQLQIFLCW